MYRVLDSLECLTEIMLYQIEMRAAGNMGALLSSVKPSWGDNSLGRPKPGRNILQENITDFKDCKGILRETVHCFHLNGYLFLNLLFP